MLQIARRARRRERIGVPGFTMAPWVVSSARVQRAAPLLCGHTGDGAPGEDPLGSALRLQLAPTERLVVDGNGRQPVGRAGKRRGWTSLAPTCQDGLAVSGFDLLSKAPPVKTEQRIVCRIGGTAKRISSQHHPIPEIYCAKNGRQ